MIDQTTYLFNQLANQYLKVNIEQNIIIDPEIHKILHLLQKKVRQPKSKPYQNSQFYYLINHKNSFDQFKPTFIDIYKEYVNNEYKRKVLELSNQVLSLICQYGKQSLSKKFKQLFPQWFIMINNQNSDISNKAMNAFQIAFPTKVSIYD